MKPAAANTGTAIRVFMVHFLGVRDGTDDGKSFAARPRGPFAAARKATAQAAAR
jgi:hypothetical protein